MRQSRQGTRQLASASCIRTAFADPGKTIALCLVMVIVWLLSFSEASAQASSFACRWVFITSARTDAGTAATRNTAPSSSRHEERYRKAQLEFFPAAKLPQIKESELLQRQVAEEAKGAFNKGALRAIYRGRAVHVKILGKTSSAREGYWLQILNELRLGPEFLGVATINGDLALVTRDETGFGAQDPNQAPSDFKLTLAMQKEIRRQVDVLARAGISPVAPQFRISQFGRVVMSDAGAFRFAANPQQASQDADSAVAQVLRRWQLGGKLESDPAVASPAVSAAKPVTRSSVFRVDPPRNEYEKMFQEADATRFSVQGLPQIQEGELRERNFVGEGLDYGVENKGPYRAIYRGQKVFIKVVSQYGGPREAYWLKIVNAMGLGPRFHGMTTIGGLPAIVMEELEGVNSKEAAKAPRDMRLTKPMQAEIQRQTRLLVQNEIAPNDLQFMLSPSGRVVLVDVSLFSFESERSKAERVAKDMLQKLQQYWERMGRYESSVADSTYTFRPPNSAAIVQEAFARLQATGFSDQLLPSVSAGELRQVLPLSVSGHFQRGAFRAQYRGREVFVKLIDRTKGGPHDGHWLSVLNSLGLGPKLQGVSEMNGYLAIVTDFSPGVNTKFLERYPRGSRVTSRIVEEMRRQTEIMVQAGIVPYDLQFMIEPDGRVTLIDPGAFKLDPDPVFRRVFGEGGMRAILTSLRTFRLYDEN